MFTEETRVVNPFGSTFTHIYEANYIKVKIMKSNEIIKYNQKHVMQMKTRKTFLYT